MPCRFSSSGESAPLRETISARMTRPSPERPYSKLRTAAGHVRAKASANCSTSSRRPVWRNWDFSATVCKSMETLMSKGFEQFIIDIENQYRGAIRRHGLARVVEPRDVLALVHRLAIWRLEAVVDAQARNVALAGP